MITGFNLVDTWRTAKRKNALIAALLENFLIRKFSGTMTKYHVEIQ